MFEREYIDRFWSKIKASSNGCWEWVGARNVYGYGKMTVHTKTVLVHRMAWMIANGDIPTGLSVLHRCDNRKCCNPSHLFLGTIHDNMRDKIQKGRQSHGEKHCAVLTEEQVVEIRSKYIPRIYSMQRLANEYGVSHGAIEGIVYRYNWKHVV